MKFTVSARPSADRYLLCRPRGGLGDALSTVELCRQHCLRTGRTLVVDGVRSNFVRDFSKVFKPTAKGQMLLAPPRGLLRHLDTLSCRPDEVQGRLRRYSVQVYTQEGRNPLEWRMPLDARTGALLHVPLGDDHPESVLLFEAHGNGLGGEQFLAQCLLSPRIVTAVRRQLAAVSELAEGYVGVHVRNSDLQSDWRGFLEAKSSELAGRTVVVCSDDGEVLREAPTLLKRSRLITPSEVPTSGGVPYQGQFVPRRLHRRMAVDVLVDLLALAGAEEIICPPVNNRTNPSSSFTRLARAIAQTPGLREQLLSG